LLTTD